MRSHIGSGNEGPPRRVAEDESLFLEVRGNQFKLGDAGSNFESTGVFVEIAQDRMIYSKRYRVFWADEVVPQIEFETLDRKKLSEEEYRSLRQRLSAYLPTIGSERDVALTPTDCSITVGGVSPAIISVGQKFRSADTRFVFPSSCESSSGVVVRDDLNSIIESLPPLDGVADSKIE